MSPTASATAERPKGLGASPRVALAAVAERAAGQLPGVSLTDGGSALWQTAEHGHRIHGVSAVVQPDGRFGLRLRVAVSWPPEPLLGLAADLRHRIVDAAAAQDLTDVLGDVDIDIVAVDTPAEPDRRQS